MTFSKEENDAFFHAIVAACRASADGPARQLLVEAVRGAKARATAWSKKQHDEADEPT